MPGRIARRAERDRIRRVGRPPSPPSPPPPFPKSLARHAPTTPARHAPHTPTHGPYPAFFQHACQGFAAAADKPPPPRRKCSHRRCTRPAGRVRGGAPAIAAAQHKDATRLWAAFTSTCRLRSSDCPPGRHHLPNTHSSTPHLSRSFLSKQVLNALKHAPRTGEPQHFRILLRLQRAESSYASYAFAERTLLSQEIGPGSKPQLKAA